MTDFSFSFGSALFGWIADHTKSRRSPFLLGLLALTGATVLLCVGKSIGVLMLGRILQGFSAAIVWTVGLALLVDTVGQRNIGHAMGYVFISLSLAFPMAPLLGGLVYDHGGYYEVFAMSFGLLGLDIILRLVLIEKKIAAQWQVEQQPQEQSTLVDARPATSAPEVDENATVTETRPEKASEVSAPAPAPAASATPAPVTEPTVGQGRKAKWSDRLPPVITLLKSRRLLNALWCSLVEAGVFAGFESVRAQRARTREKFFFS